MRNSRNSIQDATLAQALNVPNYRDIEVPSQEEKYKWLLVIAKIASIFIIVITFPFSLLLSIKRVYEFERAVIFRMGRLRKGGPRGPGIFFIIPCIDEWTLVDLRIRTFDIVPQEVLTKDAVSIKVNAVIYYRIIEPFRSIINIKNFSLATRHLAATILRKMVGTKNLDEVLSDRQSIIQNLIYSLESGTNSWGVKVIRIDFKEVSLPTGMQRGMAIEAEARQEALAKIIAANGELKAAEALVEAANTITKSPNGMFLRYLQTLSVIGNVNNNTVVYPSNVFRLQ